MAAKRSPLFQKALKLLLIIGLPLILSLAIFLLLRKSKFGWFNTYTVKQSEYKNLLPYIEAQAKHETGNYTSRAYLENNNLFGMKNATKRKQLGKYAEPYRKYLTDRESIRDLLIYFDYVKFPKSVSSAEQFAQELKNRAYYEDTVSNYTNGIKRFLA